MKLSTWLRPASISSEVWHFTDLDSMSSIIKNDKFLPSAAFIDPYEGKHNEGRLFYFSTARSLLSPYGKIESLNVVMKLDGEQFNHKFKSKSIGKEVNELEDRVLTDNPWIDNASKYIKEIRVTMDPENPIFSKQDIEKLKTLEKFAKDRGKDFFIYPNKEEMAKNISKTKITTVKELLKQHHKNGGKIIDKGVSYIKSLPKDKLSPELFNELVNEHKKLKENKIKLLKNIKNLAEVIKHKNDKNIPLSKDATKFLKDVVSDKIDIFALKSNIIKNGGNPNVRTSIGIIGKDLKKSGDYSKSLDILEDYLGDLKQKVTKSFKATKGMEPKTKVEPKKPGEKDPTGEGKVKVQRKDTKRTVWINPETLEDEEKKKIYEKAAFFNKTN